MSQKFYRRVDHTHRIHHKNIFIDRVLPNTRRKLQKYEKKGIAKYTTKIAKIRKKGYC